MKHRKLTIMGYLVLMSVCLLGLAVNPAHALDKTQASKQLLSSKRQVWTGIINRLIEKVVKVDENLKIDRKLGSTYILVFSDGKYKLQMEKCDKIFTLKLIKYHIPPEITLLDYRVNVLSRDLYDKCQNLWENGWQYDALVREHERNKKLKKALQQADQAFR